MIITLCLMDNHLCLRAKAFRCPKLKCNCDRLRRYQAHAQRASQKYMPYVSIKEAQKPGETDEIVDEIK